MPGAVNVKQRAFRSMEAARLPRRRWCRVLVLDMERPMSLPYRAEDLTNDHNIRTRALRRSGPGRRRDTGPTPYRPNAPTGVAAPPHRWPYDRHGMAGH